MDERRYKERVGFEKIWFTLIERCNDMRGKPPFDSYINYVIALDNSLVDIEGQLDVNICGGSQNNLLSLVKEYKHSQWDNDVVAMIKKHNEGFGVVVDGVTYVGASKKLTTSDVDLMRFDCLFKKILDVIAKSGFGFKYVKVKGKRF